MLDFRGADSWFIKDEPDKIDNSADIMLIHEVSSRLLVCAYHYARDSEDSIYISGPFCDAGKTIFEYRSRAKS